MYVRRNVIYVRYINCSYNNMAKGTRLLDKKAFLFIQEKIHASKSFLKIYPLNAFGGIFPRKTYIRYHSYCKGILILYLRNNTSSPQDFEFTRPDCMYMQAAKALSRLHRCAWLFELLLLLHQCTISYTALSACDFQQCGILTSVDSDESVQPPFKLRNSK